MTGYTKGPWIEGIVGNNSVYGPDGMGRDSGLIATVYKGRGNIRLIAAAPDMYEALKGALHAVDIGLVNIRPQDREVFGQLLTEVNAALSKAEGAE